MTFSRKIRMYARAGLLGVMVSFAVLFGLDKEKPE